MQNGESTFEFLVSAKGFGFLGFGAKGLGPGLDNGCDRSIDNGCDRSKSESDNARPLQSEPPPLLAKKQCHRRDNWLLC